MEQTPKSASFSIKKLIPLLIIVIVAVIGFVALKDVLNFETLRDNRETLIAWRDSNYLLAALAYIIVYIAVVAFSLPGGLIMTLTGGFLFGLIAGSLFTVIGATLGAVGIFMAAKTGLGDVLHKKMQSNASGGLLKRVEQGLHENEISYLFLMRLVPAVPFFVANIAPAFFGVKLRNYVLTTFFGIMPGTVVFSSVGAGLGDVFARGDTPDLGIIFAPHVLGPILGLCVLAALPIVIKKFSSKKV